MTITATLSSISGSEAPILGVGVSMIISSGEAYTKSHYGETNGSYLSGTAVGSVYFASVSKKDYNTIRRNDNHSSSKNFIFGANFSNKNIGDVCTVTISNPCVYEGAYTNPPIYKSLDVQPSNPFVLYNDLRPREINFFAGSFPALSSDTWISVLPIFNIPSSRRGTFHVDGFLGHNYNDSSYECAHISFIYKANTISSGVVSYSAKGILNNPSSFKQIRLSITSEDIASLDVLLSANTANSYWFIPLSIGFNEKDVLNVPYYCDLALQWSNDPKDRSVEVFTPSVTNVTVS